MARANDDNKEKGMGEKGDLTKADEVIKGVELESGDQGLTELDSTNSVSKLVEVGRENADTLDRKRRGRDEICCVGKEKERER